jgi:cell wall-associated NlpC family hydrolase
MIPRNKFGEKMQKFIDAPYSLGDETRGWDCLNLLRHFFKDIGKELPEFPKDWTWENYAERWKNGEGRKEFKKYLMDMGTEIEPNFMMHGDLLIFEGRQMTFCGIYLGAGHILSVFDIGCKVIPWAVMKKFLVSARRL